VSKYLLIFALLSSVFLMSTGTTLNSSFVNDIKFQMTVFGISDSLLEDGAMLVSFSELDRW